MGAPQLGVDGEVIEADRPQVDVSGDSPRRDCTLDRRDAAGNGNRARPDNASVASQGNSRAVGSLDDDHGFSLPGSLSIAGQDGPRLRSYARLRLDTAAARSSEPPSRAV
jgi:hypothetical protein